MEIVLTVGDHEKNGFVALACWRGLEEAEARRIIGAIDAEVDPAAEPDIKTAPFTFILDLTDGPDNTIDNGERNLPMQVAMRIAPDQVSRWLDERPNPDEVYFYDPPTLPISSFG